MLTVLALCNLVYGLSAEGTEGSNCPVFTTSSPYEFLSDCPPGCASGLWDPYSNIHMGMCGEMCAAAHGCSRDQMVRSLLLCELKVL